MAVSGEGRAFELVRVPDGDRDAWLAVRREGVGGSDVAAIMGLSRYRTALQVWAEKTGRADPADISDRPAVEWGNRLEPLVGRKYADEHPDREVRRVNAICRSLARPWAQASLDYEVRDPELGWGVLEIKTAGLRSAADWEEGVPVWYQTQVAHYLSVTGRPFADVAVLIGGQDYREYRLARDAEDEAAVVGAVDGFWADVLADRPPAAEAADAGFVHELFADGGDMLEADETPAALSRWLLASAECDAARAERDRWGARLRQLVGEHRGISCPDGRLTWVRGTSRRFDSRRFRAERPDEWEEYAVESERDGGLRWRPATERG